MKLAKTTLAKHENVCKSFFPLYIAIFTINVVIGTYLTYYKDMNHNKEIVAKESLIYQTTIWLNEISNM